MEPITDDPFVEGIVQAVTGVVTAPYGLATGENTGVDRLPSSATWRAPNLPSLFGSQDAVPVLAAPTEAVVPRPRGVALSRAALATVGAVVFASGLLMGTAAARRAPRAPELVAAAVTAPARPEPVVAPAPAPALVADEAPVADFAAPATIEVPDPVKISARKRPAARRVSAPVAAEKEAPGLAAPVAKTAWVNPFAD